jgi:hypothetical protein
MVYMNVKKLLIVVGCESTCIPHLGVVVSADVSNSAVNQQHVVSAIIDAHHDADVTLLMLNSNVAVAGCKCIVAHDLNDLIARFKYITDPKLSGVHYDVVISLIHMLPRPCEEVMSVEKGCQIFEHSCYAERSVSRVIPDAHVAALTFEHVEVVNSRWHQAVGRVRTHSATCKVVNVVTTFDNDARDIENAFKAARRAIDDRDMFDVIVIVPLTRGSDLDRALEPRACIVGRASAAIVDVHRMSMSIAALVGELNTVEGN